MKVPPETICSIEKCKKIFCCADCRLKHEKKMHASVLKKENISPSTSIDEIANLSNVHCPICLNQPLPLRQIPEEVLAHIKQNHLPLHCRKCAKVYTKMEELREISKCVTKATEKSLLSEKCKFVATTQTQSLRIFGPIALHSTATQTSPMFAAESKVISVQNLCSDSRTQKTAQEINFSSTRLLSLTGSNPNYCRPGDTKGKLVRTTSTPVHYEAEYLKPKEQTFNASGAQVSSIYSSGCETDNEKNSLIFVEMTEKPASQFAVPAKGDGIYNYRKFGGRSKIAAVTPLRHVMSKSIQKAFAEHGLPATTEQGKQELKEASAVLMNLPLDLRLSPALRRCQSDSNNCYKSNNGKDVASNRADHLSCRTSTDSLVAMRAQKLRDCDTVDEAFNSDSAVSSVSNSSVYKTCQSDVSDILGATEATDQLYALKNKSVPKSPKQSSAINTPITRIPGVNFTKKLIKFETPNVKNDSNCEKFYTPKCGSPTESNNSSNSFASKLRADQEYIKFSPMARRSIRECAQSTAYSHCDVDYDSTDEVFLTPTNGNSKKVETSDQSTQHGNGFIWSFMSSVMQKGTRFLDNKRLPFDANAKVKNSFIKRCSSIAGSLVRSNSLLDEKQLQSMKRKRTNTFDSPTSPLSTVQRVDSLPIYHNLDSASSSKRFRIQGRKPIERMRNTSL